jgi:acetyl esterase
MPLHPQAAQLLEAAKAQPLPDPDSLSAPQLRALIGAMPPPPALDEVTSAEDRRIPGPGGELAVRVYRPAGASPKPVTVYFHGGGFVLCDLDSHDAIARALCARADCVVVSVEYRRAPEAPFPAAVDDAIAAVEWVAAHAGELGADAGRMAVAGDSAGANLATVAARALRGTAAALRHQLLLYPVTDCRCDSASYRDFAEGYYLSAAMMRWFIRQYLPEASLVDDPRASPLRAPDLAGMPGATVITAEYDPLRDEGEAYARALEAAGVPVALTRWPGQIHGFASMTGMLDDASAALDEAAGALRAAFAAA